ncbi:putative uv-damaged dna-binding protein [Erysiphe neolycopersici]|uniref:Putative uv-damaged dna-binding protein n=1 Tax=Erysiphe neolycopersici TaxID=212602 RepID=A0A420HTN8_9PEZI|nr:putative uv-damaged dna-binding protein [Erysiphe neolycopersici]
MVVPFSLPTVLQSLDTPDSSPFDYVEFSSITSDGISDIVSEKLTFLHGDASKDRVRSKIQQKLKIREDLLNDIQSRRELVSRGKVGNRRRKRYENANFFNVPNSQPPLPSDWEVYPTYPVYHNVPYYLASLWDSKFQRISEERTKSKSFTPPHGKVSQDLKLALKKAKGARYLLLHLEDEVRKFIQRANDERTARATCQSQEEIDAKDEEIVFIGRDKDGKVITMSDQIIRPVEQDLQNEKLIFETTTQDGGSFMRWLIYELAEYYGLKTCRAICNGNDKECIRIILPGFWCQENEESSNSMKKSLTYDNIFQMPRPLCGLV